jgi:hypothetical protein
MRKSSIHRRDTRSTKLPDKGTRIHLRNFGGGQIVG